MHLGIVGSEQAPQPWARGRAAPGFALQTGWLLAYAGIGGGTNLLALYAGFQLFRATNRIGAFISCIVLIYVAIHMTRWLRARPRCVSVSFAALITIIGVLDQIPKRVPLAEREATRARVAADRAFGRTLEETLPAGSMVFQLPILGFPEVVPPHNLADYELFRPFLNTTTLRFSYGGTKYRSRNRWQRDLENLPPLGLVKKLERFGFAALYLNRKGFADGGEQTVQALRNAGYTRILEGSLKEQYVILLNPRKKRELPLGSTFTFGKGWYTRPMEGPEGKVWWAHGPAVITYYNPYDRPLSVRIQLRLSAPKKRTVTIVSSGNVVVRAEVGPEAKTLAPVAVDLSPGVNRFDVSADGPAVKVPGSGARLRMVGMHEVRLSVPELPPLVLLGEPNVGSTRNCGPFLYSHVDRSPPSDSIFTFAGWKRTYPDAPVGRDPIGSVARN